MRSKKEVEMQRHYVKTQQYNQFERSPESFPKTIIFPEAWDLSELKDAVSDPQPVVNAKVEPPKKANEPTPTII
jgi:hypothetical protein